MRPLMSGTTTGTISITATIIVMTIIVIVKRR